MTAWDEPAMRPALAHHDLQIVFRLLQRYGATQRVIAAATGMAQSDVSEILCGHRRVVAYAVLSRLADGLDLPRGWLGLAYDEETVALCGRPVAPLALAPLVGPTRCKIQRWVSLDRHRRLDSG